MARTLVQFCLSYRGGNFDKRYPSALIVPSLCFVTLCVKKRKVESEGRQFQQKWIEEFLHNALDEITDLSDTAQLAIFIRGVDKEFTVTEELLALEPLKGTTTGKDIFIEVQKKFTSFDLLWSNLVGVCSDRVPSMVGLHKGFIGILNERATELNVQKDD
ncbi:General transcription factor II-I repeat domain-containing protein 2 [Eumeta japonica]|uniref:General transcription factor II-I repeat domain-containing protein 2 n=1 Tax=Eumeta variegata TaxID=151549 RepID=A0A4C1Y404_EUMVA|nr:General transcription factor II-I repeat domain-containing protein 2 [Eumeta japonica]